MGACGSIPQGPGPLVEWAPAPRVARAPPLLLLLDAGTFSLMAGGLLFRRRRRRGIGGVDGN